MNRILILIVIGAITFAVLLFAKNPQLFDEIWLYAIGLMGGIVHLFKLVGSKLKTFAADFEKETKPPQKITTEEVEAP